MNTLSSSSSSTRCLIIPLLIACFFAFSLADSECGKTIKENTTCTFFRNGKEIPKANYGLFHIADLHLYAKDSLTVSINDKTRNISYFSDGLLFLPKQANYTFTLTTSVDVGSRSFRTFELLAASRISVQELQTFGILVTQDVTPEYIELENDDPATSILLSTESNGVTAESYTNNSQLANKTDMSKSDFLTGDKRIKLSFSLNKTEDNFYNFNLLKATKRCSGIFKEPAELVTIDKNSVPTKATCTCVYLVSSTDSKDNLQITASEIKTTSSFDTLIVKDGLRLASKDLIYSRTKDAPSILSDLSKTVSSSNGVLVILQSSLVVRNYEQSKIKVEKSTIKKFVSETSLNLEAENEATYIFNLKEKYPALQFEKSWQLKNAGLKVYESTDLLVEPVLKFESGDYVNTDLWSKSHFLILKFTGKLESQKATFLAKEKNCDLMSNHPSTFALNGSLSMVNQICNFYFKPEDTARSILFNLGNIVLNDGACLTMKNVSQQLKIFNFCAPAGKEGGILKYHLPEIMLPSNESYVLTYDEKNTYQEKILVQASFAYSPFEPARILENLTIDHPTQLITSFNYPSNYPYMLSKDLVSVASDSNIFVSFHKYDLREGDDLNLYNRNVSRTLKDIDDFIVFKEPLIAKLNTKFSSPQLLSDQFASGFKMEAQRIECVLIYNETSRTISTPGWPDKFVNATKCISVVNLNNGPKYLNVIVQNGRDTTVDYGNLTFFDDPNSHRQIDSLEHAFNNTMLKNNETLNFNLSSTKIVIKFDPRTDQPKAINGFQITLNAKECPYKTCDDKTRCLIEEVHCNFVTECRDKTDEMGCTRPDIRPPSPVPEPKTIYRGLSGWVIVFIIIPLSMICGAMLLLHGPKLMTRFRGHRYHEFNTFTENA